MTEDAAVTMKITFGLIGIITVVLGYLIGVKKKLNLIAGYKPEKTRDAKGLARFMGTWTVITGVVVGIYPWLYGVQRSNASIWSTIFFIPIGVIIVVMIVGCSHYEHKTSK